MSRSGSKMKAHGCGSSEAGEGIVARKVWMGRVGELEDSEDWSRGTSGRVWTRKQPGEERLGIVREGSEWSAAFTCPSSHASTE